MVLFTSQKAAVAGIVRAINKLGYEAQGISSDRTQEEREQIMRDFKNKKFPILVATDVAARGLGIALRQCRLYFLRQERHIIRFDLARAIAACANRRPRTSSARSA